MRDRAVRPYHIAGLMAGRAHHKVAGKLCHPVLALEYGTPKTVTAPAFAEAVT